MLNETRNELLILLTMQKKETAEDKKFQLEYLLERFERDIEVKIEDANRVIKQEQENLETLKYVREQLGIK